jgi:hypothetical protein
MRRRLIVAGLLLTVSPLVGQADRSVTLALKFPAGQAEQLSITQELRQTLSGGPLKEPLKQQQKQVTEGTLKVVRDGVLDLAFDRIRSSDNFRGREVSYDSDKDKESKDPSAQVLNGLIGAKARLRFGDGGKLEEFEGMNDVLDQLARKFPEQKAMLAQLKETLGDAVYQQQLGGFLSGFLPGRPVAVGDAWFANQTQTLAGLGKLQLRIQYKLEAIEQRDGRAVARISFTGRGDFEGLVGVKLSIEEIQHKGTILFDIDRGGLIEHQSEQSLKGGVAVPMEGKETRIDFAQRVDWTVLLSPGK